MGQDARFGDEGDNEQDRRRNERCFEGHPGRRGGLARPLHGKEVEAEEDPGRDAEGVAKGARRLQLKALRKQGAAAQQTQSEPTEDFGRDALAKQQPAEDHDPDRRGRGEKGRVGDARVDDRQMPEEEISREGEAREDRRPRKSRRGPAVAIRGPHPCPEQGQRKRHAPERARKRTDVREPDKDWRNAHRDRPDDQGCKGGKEALRRCAALRDRHSVDFSQRGRDSTSQRTARCP